MEDVIDALREVAIEQTCPLELPDEDRLVEIEEELLLPLPRALKDFLLNVSDLVIGSLEPVTVCDSYAHTHLPELTTQAWADGMARELIVICAIGEGCYCINQQGEVLLWQSGQMAEDAHWQDIWQWAYQVWLNS